MMPAVCLAYPLDSEFRVNWRAGATSLESERVLAAAVFDHYAASERRIDRAYAQPIAVFAGDFFDIAPTVRVVFSGSLALGTSQVESLRQ